MKRRSEPSVSRWRHNLAYFVDRDLGAKILPGRLREEGITIVTHFEVAELADDVPDDGWIRWACSRGFICLSHDKAILRQEAAKEVFRHANPPGALFILRGSVPVAEHAERFLEVQRRVETMVMKHRRKGEAFIAVIRRATRKGGRVEIVVETHDKQVVGERGDDR